LQARENRAKTGVDKNWLLRRNHWSKGGGRAGTLLKQARKKTTQIVRGGKLVIPRNVHQGQTNREERSKDQKVRPLMDTPDINYHKTYS